MNLPRNLSFLAAPTKVSAWSKKSGCMRFLASLVQGNVIPAFKIRSNFSICEWHTFNNMQAYGAKALLERIRCPCSWLFQSHSAEVNGVLGVKLLHIYFESGLARGLSRGGVSSACRRRLSGAFAVTQSDSVRWPAALAQAMSTCMQCDLGSGVQSALQGQGSAPRQKRQPQAISFRLSPAPPP